MLVGGCTPLGGPPDETFEPMIVGVVDRVTIDGRDTNLVFADGSELRVDHIVALEGVSIRPGPGDLVLYSDDVGGSQWMRVGRGEESCWVFQDGFAWDGGDHWIFQSGLSLATAPDYELPDTDDEPGGWVSDTSRFCLDAAGRITEGPWGPSGRGDWRVGVASTGILRAEN